MKLKNSVAVVTGASHGIGSAIARELAREGAKVAVNFNKSEDGARKVVDEIKSFGGDAVSIRADVTRFEEVKTMMHQAREELGEIDILVNNSGGQPPATTPSLFCEKTEACWDAYIGLNLKSVFNGCRAVIESMIERRSGKIVNIASLAGVIGVGGATDYSAAKAGVIGFTKALAKEVAAYGINVNSISPGPIVTPTLLSALNEDQLEEQRKMAGMSRLGKPEDDAYRFLLSFPIISKINIYHKLIYFLTYFKIPLYWLKVVGIVVGTATSGLLSFLVGTKKGRRACQNRNVSKPNMQASIMLRRRRFRDHQTKVNGFSISAIEETENE